MRHQEFPTELKQLMISVPNVEEKHLLLNASYLYIKKHILSLHRSKTLILYNCSMLLQSPVGSTLCLDFDSSLKNSKFLNEPTEHSFEQGFVIIQILQTKKLRF